MHVDFPQPIRLTKPASLEESHNMRIEQDSRPAASAGQLPPTQRKASYLEPAAPQTAPRKASYLEPGLPVAFSGSGSSGASSAATKQSLDLLQATAAQWLRLDFDRNAAQAEIAAAPAGGFIVRKSNVDGALVFTQRTRAALAKPAAGPHLRKPFINILILKTAWGYRWASIDGEWGPLDQLLAVAINDPRLRRRIGAHPHLMHVPYLHQP